MNYNLKLELHFEEEILECLVTIIDQIPGNQILERMLHPIEIFKYQEIKYSNKKNSYAMGRFAAKTAINMLTNTPHQDFYIDNGVFSQPIVVSQKINNLCVSITHAHKISGAIAFPENAKLGLDIEEVDETNAEIINKHLTEYEKGLCTEKREACLLWSAKEALSKALTTGLTIPFPLLEIKNHRQRDGYCEYEFKNFGQYQGVGFLANHHCFALVYPINLKINSKETSISSLIKAFEDTSY